MDLCIDRMAMDPLLELCSFAAFITEGYCNQHLPGNLPLPNCLPLHSHNRHINVLSRCPCRATATRWSQTRLRSCRRHHYSTTAARRGESAVSVWPTYMTRGRSSGPRITWLTSNDNSNSLQPWTNSRSRLLMASRLM